MICDFRVDLLGLGASSIAESFE